MIVVRHMGPRPVALGVVSWAIVMGACLFVAWTSGFTHAHSSTSSTVYWIAGALTAALGAWLGWRHRVGTAFVAPLFAWFVLVPFAFASGFATSGILHGLWRGLYLSTVGGFGAAFVEGVLLVAFATLGRIASAVLGHGGDSDVVILPPGTS